jgi:L-ascorbate metabolism protein UlaG (beta-lactamase superfamily)
MDAAVLQPPEDRLPRRVRFLGHATVLIDLDNTRILTDPLLRRRVSALFWAHPSPHSRIDHPVDAVVISHMHQDHLDLPSLRQLGHDVPLLVPRRAESFLARRGFVDAHEMRAGQRASVGEVRVVATPARHTGFRPPFGPMGGCLGFIVEGSARVYFAGDTDIFPEMADLGPIDVALLPVAGWGPTLGPGHMNAHRAAQALQLIRPKIAIPIHWGTFAPVGMHMVTWRYLTQPPLDFLEHARRLAPDVEVRILEPGDALDLDGDTSPLVPVAHERSAHERSAHERES